MGDIKKRVQSWWNSSPCCSKATTKLPETRQFYEEVDLYKDTYEPFTDGIADYALWKGKRVLEIGCGLGKDFSRFAAAGAKAIAIDMSYRSLELTKKRLEIFGLKGDFFFADGEDLPFKDNSFELIFSWGVIHHTPDTQKVIDEIYRCTKSDGGKVIIMLYGKHSFVNFKFNMRYLFKSNKAAQLAAYTDGEGNPLSKVYSRKEARKMFSRFKNIQITAYESKSTPYAKIFNIFKGLEKYFGWFMVIKAEK